MPPLMDRSDPVIRSAKGRRVKWTAWEVEVFIIHLVCPWIVENLIFLDYRRSKQEN